MRVRARTTFPSVHFGTSSPRPRARAAHRPSGEDRVLAWLEAGSSNHHLRSSYFSLGEGHPSPSTPPWAPAPRRVCEIPVLLLSFRRPANGPQGGSEAKLISPGGFVRPHEIPAAPRLAAGYWGLRDWGGPRCRAAGDYNSQEASRRRRSRHSGTARGPGKRRGRGWGPTRRLVQKMGAAWSPRA